MEYGQVPEIRSRPYVWTAQQLNAARAVHETARVAERTKDRIESILAMGLPPRVADELIRGWIRLGAGELAMARLNPLFRPVQLIPSARRAA